MKRAWFMMALALVLMPAPASAANSICDLDHVPPYPSYNSSMLLIIGTSDVASKMAGLTSPVKVNWEVSDSFFNPVPSPWGIGSMHKFKDCYVCEFSGTSYFDASCGPTPFTESGMSYLIDYHASDMNEHKDFNTTLTTHFVRADAEIVVGDSGSIEITVYPQQPHTSEVYITLYDTKTGDALSSYTNRNLTEDHSVWTMNIDSLKSGTYYAAITARTEDGSAGGSLYKFDVEPESEELVISTDETTYWIGQKVVITGRSKYDSVTVTVTTPAGGSIPLGKKTVSDDKFSYEFTLLGNYLPGNYTINANAEDAVQQAKIEARQLFTLGKDKLSFTFTDDSPKAENITVFNAAGKSITLTATTEGITGYAAPVLSSNIVGTNTAVTLTVTGNPTGLTGTKEGKILVSCDNESVTLPIDVTLTRTAAQCPQVPAAGGIELSPGLWDETDCLAGQTLNESISIENNGDSAISTFSAKSSDVDIVGTDFPDSINAGDDGTMEISIKVGSSGKASGEVEVDAGGFKRMLYVNFYCSKDVADDITQLTTSVDDLKEAFTNMGFSEDSVYTIFVGLDTDLSDASDYLAANKYSDSAENYAAASAKYDALNAFVDEMAVNPPADSSGSIVIIIVLSVVLVGLLGFIIYDKLGAKLFRRGGVAPQGGGSEGESGESYDEELY